MLGRVIIVTMTQNQRDCLKRFSETKCEEMSRRWWAAAAISAKQKLRRSSPVTVALAQPCRVDARLCLFVYTRDERMQERAAGTRFINLVCAINALRVGALAKHGTKGYNPLSPTARRRPARAADPRVTMMYCTSYLSYTERCAVHCTCAPYHALPARRSVARCLCNTSALRRSPPFTFLPRVSSHKPSLGRMTATIPLVPATLFA